MAATIRSALFHPEHLLTRYQYAEASSSTATYSCSCVACERTVTGIGYRCDDGECDFNIHEACLLTLPGSTSIDQHTKEHLLTLTRLPMGAARCCHICKQTSHAGS
jgi:hypothetical protein